MLALLLTIASGVQPGAEEVRLRAEPSEGEVCAWQPTSEESSCQDYREGLLVMTLPREGLVEIRSEGYFGETLRVEELRAKESIRLDPLPSVQWPGWSDRRAVMTRVEWLSNKNGASWQKIGDANGPATFRLPDAFRAIRFVPALEDFAGYTVFPEQPRSALTVVRSRPLLAGHEIALCVEKKGAPMPDSAVMLTAEDGKPVATLRTGQRGCTSFVTPASGALILRAAKGEFQPRTLNLAREAAFWAGVLEAADPARVVAKVNDSDPTRLYRLRLESVLGGDLPTEDEKPVPVRELRGGEEAVWTVAPGSYSVLAVSESILGAEFSATVDAVSGRESTVTLEPVLVQVAGTVTRNGEPAGGISLRFEHEKKRTMLRVETRTSSDGEYQVVLPAEGLWSVTAAMPGRVNWLGGRLQQVVPSTSLFKWDIALPAGRVAGIIVVAESGAPVKRIQVRLQWTESDSTRGLMTTMTDDDGLFEFDSLPSDVNATVEPLELAVRAHGLVPPTPVQVRIALTPSRVEFRLRKLDSAAMVRVVSTNGLPEAEAQVFTVEGIAPRLLGVTDGEGRWAVPSDLPLPLEICIVTRGKPWQRVRVESSENDIRVTMPPWHDAITEIVFVPSGGTPLADVVWGLLDQSGRYIPVLYHLLRQGVPPTAQGGRASLPLAASGQYRVWVLRGGKVDVLGTIVLPSRNPLFVSLR